jgi:tetratricopeptide (TPR) repeat protein
MTIDIYQGQDLFIPKQLWQARFYRVAGNEAEAVRLYEETLPILDTAVAERPDEPSIYVSLAESYANLGMKEEALAAAERAMELLPITKDFYAGGDYYIAYVDTLVAVGKFEKAIEGAEYLLSIPGNFSLNWVELDPRWDPIREYPGYKELLAKHGISRER